MGLTRPLIGIVKRRCSLAITIRCTDGHGGVTHITFPTATIDITAGTAGNIGSGAGCKALNAKGIVDGTQGTGGIDILVHFATKQGNISGAIDITTFCHAFTFLTKATAIGIVAHVCTLADNDVGVVFVCLGFSVVNLSRSCQSIGQVGVSVVKIAGAIGSNGKVFRV